MEQRKVSCYRKPKTTKSAFACMFRKPKSRSASACPILGQNPPPPTIPPEEFRDPFSIPQVHGNSRGRGSSHLLSHAGIHTQSEFPQQSLPTSLLFQSTLCLIYSLTEALEDAEVDPNSYLPM